MFECVCYIIDISKIRVYQLYNVEGNETSMVGSRAEYIYGEDSQRD